MTRIPQRTSDDARTDCIPSEREPWWRRSGAALVCLLLMAPASRAQPSTQPLKGWQLDWARDAVFYEVFVRSFADSDGDGIGDLRGLAAKLDYLNDGDPATDGDLGVTALWLMPIFESPSYHGYDTTDYRRIDPDYGTLEDFRSLLAEAHRRGIRVILDLMINHSSVQHPWFVDSASSPTSRKRDWYVWKPTNLGWRQPWGDGPTWHFKNGAFYYGIFWSGMPDLNLGNPAVRAEFRAIADHWLDLGVDGFRLDAARHLFANGPGELQNDQPETHAFWREFAAYVRSRHPSALLVGENWTDGAKIATYFGSSVAVPEGDELPASFDFPVAEALTAALTSGEAEPIRLAVDSGKALRPKAGIDATFADNHDQQRLISRFATAAEPRVRSLLSVLLTLPGTPFLYYGDELGLTNGQGSDDREKRTPMPWDASPTGGFSSASPWFPFTPGRERANVATQTADPASLLSLVRRLIHLRESSSALRRGTVRWLEPQEPVPGLLAYELTFEGETLLVAHNLADQAIWKGAGPLRPARLTPLWTSPEASALSIDDTVQLVLPPYASGIWRLEH